MNRKYRLIPFLVLLTIVSRAQNEQVFKGYRFTIDLSRANNDKLKVELKTPAITKNTITYHIPKIVPGTYSEDDYGRYIEQFKAFNKKGDTLPVVRQGRQQLDNFKFGSAGRFILST